MRIKKAQKGTTAKKKPADDLSRMNEPTPKGYVRGEMTGRLMPISERRKREKEMAESLNEFRFGTKNPAAKPAPVKKAPAKKNMKSGGKSFPDLTGDGKVTKADILKGRGVIKSGGKVKMKRGGAMKKCKYGC
jgi:hypothetical protein